MPAPLQIHQLSVYLTVKAYSIIAADVSTCMPQLLCLLLTLLHITHYIDLQMSPMLCRACLSATWSLFQHNFVQAEGT